MYTIYADGTLICSSKIEELAIINPVIKLEVNSAGTFTFTMPPQHPYYSLIQKKTTLIDIYRDNETEPLFEGICASDEVDFFKQKKIVCEGELTFLNDSNLRPSHKVGLTSRQLLTAYINEHNSLVEAKKRFTVGQVTAKDDNDYITCFTNYQSTMTEIKEDLVDDIGGYLRTRHVNGVRYLDYLAESPRTNNQVIRLGENLLDISVGIDTDDLATVIIPLGETLETQSIEGLDERLNIKTAPADSMHPAGKDYVFSQSAVNSFGWIEKVVEWDGVTVVSNLVEKGKKYLQETQFENLVIEAKAIDLGLTSDEFQKFKLLDKVRVLSEPHGLDKYFLLSQMEIHLNNPEQDTITLGSKQANSLSAKSASANAEIMKRIEQMPTSNAVKSAIDNATALITGAEGGYVVITRNSSGQPIEIKIQDALNNPTKIWRWNVNGLGYSNDGGRTYGLAMTMDGSIVADYITSGAMTATRVRGGELLVGGSGLSANAQITIKDSNNNTIGYWNRNGIYAKGRIEADSGKIAGFNINDLHIQSYNGNTLDESTYRAFIQKYSSPSVVAFGVQGRDSTSDNWDLKFYVSYNGRLYANNAYIEGEVYASSGKISDFSIEAGQIYTNDAARQAYIGMNNDENNHNWNIDGTDYKNAFGVIVNNGTEWLSRFAVSYSGDVLVGRGADLWLEDVSTLVPGNGITMNAAGPGFTLWGSFNNHSDRRWKKDITSLSENFVNTIYDLEPISFKYNDKYKDSDDKTHYGFIAQDVKKALEDNEIDTDNLSLYQETKVKDRDHQMVDACLLSYQEFIPLIVATLQAQKKEIDELKEEIKLLKGEN